MQVSDPRVPISLGGREDSLRQFGNSERICNTRQHEITPDYGLVCGVR